MKKGLKFSKEQLEELYLNQKLSLNQIGEKFGCGGTNILYWLKKFEIKRRPAYPKKIHVPKELLRKLYWDQNLKPREIAKMFGIKNGRTILKKLKKYGIPRKSVSEALTTKFKAPFNGDLTEKAFFLGLRAGDFYAQRMKQSIRVQTTTTHKAQIDLLKDSFKNYGELRIYLQNGDWGEEWFIYADLDKSFSFLLQKPQKIPKWILDNNNYFYSFLTAYFDCEGCLYLSKSHEIHSRYNYRLRTGDRKVLEQMQIKLKKEFFHPILRLYKKAGGKTKKGYNENVDQYELVLNRKKEILKLIQIMINFSKHSEKIRKKKIFLQHKDSKHKEIEKDWLILKKEIKKEILKK
jgi:hypothetical protein